MTWSHLFVHTCFFQIAWALREGFHYVHLHSNKVPDCPQLLVKRAFPLHELRSSTPPFNIPNPNQLHLENHLFPDSIWHKGCSFISSTRYQQILLKNTQSVSWVWYSLTNNIWRTWVIWISRCCFKVVRLDQFRSDHRFILKRMKSLILCCISMSPASCKDTVPTLCSFHHVFGNICLDHPLADLCFSCCHLFWKGSARVETRSAERATALLSLLKELGKHGFIYFLFVQKKVPVLPVSCHSLNMCLGLRQRNGKIGGLLSWLTINALGSPQTTMKYIWSV